MEAEKVFTIIIHSLLAILGTAARQLQQKDKHSMRLVFLLSGCFIAAFTGIMVFFITAALSVDSNLAYATAGISGWIGPQALDGIATMVKRATGIDTNTTDD